MQQRGNMEASVVKNTAEIHVLQETPGAAGGCDKTCKRQTSLCQDSLLLVKDCLVKIESGVDRER